MRIDQYLYYNACAFWFSFFVQPFQLHYDIFSPVLFCFLFEDETYYFLRIVEIPLMAGTEAEKKPAP